MKIFSKLGLLLSILPIGVRLQAQTSIINQFSSDSLWAQYKTDPERHPNIPNCSFAGYKGSSLCPGLIPNPTLPIINVKDIPYLALGNGTGNDGPAIQAALDSAGRRGGGIVFIPNGTYRIDTMLKIRYSKVILRGESRDGAVLDFPRSLQRIYGNLSKGTNYYWWWAGGLVWIGPEDTFLPNGKVYMPDSTIQGWEVWRSSSTPSNVTTPATRGDKLLNVSTTTGLLAGQKILLVWDNPADKSFLKHLYGHSPTASNLDVSTGPTGNCAGVLPPSSNTFTWPVEIAEINGNSITLSQPLRVDIRPEWNVRIETPGQILEEVGIENLRIKCHAQLSHNHLEKPGSTKGGWNGFYFNRAWNCWLQNVAVGSAENAFILSSTKHVSLLKTLVDGAEQNHHSFACRVSSHDNLMEEFVVNGPGRVRHGINTEGFSSGNVWSKGMQKAGTFDTHRLIPFDFIRTECTVANDAGSGPGGGNSAGPFVGGRTVIWNVDISIDPLYSFILAGSNGGKFINQPKQFVMGVLAGVRGTATNTTEGWALPNGDKGTLVVDSGQIPSIVNLYQAQKQLRCGTTTEIQPRYYDIGDAFRVWPNPFHKKLYVSFFSAKSELVEIQILNVMGQQVSIQSSLSNAGKYTEFEFGSLNLTPGLYFLSIKALDKIRTKIICLNRM